MPSLHPLDPQRGRAVMKMQALAFKIKDSKIKWTKLTYLRMNIRAAYPN